MPHIASTILFSHFKRIKNVDFRSFRIYFIGKRSYKVGIELIFAASFL